MLRHYFRSAWRNLVVSKSYSVINIAGLALGLASVWMIGLYILDELSYDRFHNKADRIFRIVQHTRWNNNDLHHATTSAPFAPALLAKFPEIEDAVRIDREGGGVITVRDKRIKRDDVIFADKNILNVFSFGFLHGGGNTALDKPNSIVISETLAKSLFDNAAAAVDQTITFDDRVPVKVTGVIKDVPANAHFQFSAIRAAGDNFDAQNWQNFNLYTYILLGDANDIGPLRKKLPAFAKATIQSIMNVDDYTMELQPLTSIHLHSNLAFEAGANGNITRIYVFTAIAILILLIAIINYTNLTTARSSARVKEIGVRKAIGSGKRNIAGIFIAEAVITTFVAACIGALIVYIALPYFNTFAGKQITPGRFGWPNIVLVFFVFTVITGCISGLYPSTFLSRFHTIPALKGLVGNHPGNVLFRKSLVVFQFVTTIVIISSTIVIYQQLSFAKNSDLGFNREQLVTFHIDDQRVRGQVASLKTELLSNPAIEGAAVAGNAIGNNDLGGMGYRFSQEDGSFSTATTIAQELMIDADFVPTMNIQVLHGRNFSSAISSDKYGAALINETLMKKLGWKTALGRKIEFYVGDHNQPMQRTIVGVVRDFHTYSLQHKVEPLVMVMPPSAGSQDNIYVKVAKGRTSEGLQHMTKTFAAFDPANPAVFNFLDENFAKQYKAEEKQGQLALAFATLAIVIACLGLFGLAAFTALQRTKEIGIRKVMGAGINALVRLLCHDFIVLVAISAVIALPLAWLATNRWLEGFAYRIQVEWWVLLLASLLALIIALLTVGFHALKAATADPVKSLRSE